MATITPVVVTTAGNAVAYTAASGGGDVIAVGVGLLKTVFTVRNGGGGSITVTLAGVVPCSQGATHNTVITCPVGDTEITVPSQVISNVGNVGVTYSAVTSVTVAAVYP